MPTLIQKIDHFLSTTHHKLPYLGLFKSPLYKEVIESTAFLPEKVRASLRVYYIRNGLTEQMKCPECNTAVSGWDSGPARPMFCCSKKCAAKHCVDKRIASNIRLYGGKSSLSTPEGRKKFENTCLERYGVRNPQQSNEIRQKAYATNIERYGVAYVSQNADIHIKKMKTGFTKREFTYPTGETVDVVGYEPLFLAELVASGYSADDIITDIRIMPEIWYTTDKLHRYFPDVWIPKENKIYEVKSDYTFQADYEINQRKREASVALGLSFEFVVYDKTGRRID